MILSRFLFFFISLLFLIDTLIVCKVLQREFRKRQQKRISTLLCKKNNNFDIVWYDPRRELLDRIFVGRGSYGDLHIEDSTLADTKLYIGNYCSIAKNVWFILGNEHKLDSLTSYPLKVKRFGYAHEALSKGDIVVNDDVWIGLNAIICSGVTIGQGAVVGAGAVVTKDVPPYAIVGGVPAKVIHYRFSEAVIKKLVSVDIAELLDGVTRGALDTVYTALTDGNIDEILKGLQNVETKG